MAESAVDLSPLGDAFAALVAACPARNATVTAAEQAFTDACETIERNAALLVWERDRQRKVAGERAERERAQAGEAERKRAARKALSEKAAAARAKGS